MFMIFRRLDRKYKYKHKKKAKQEISPCKSVQRSKSIQLNKSPSKYIQICPEKKICPTKQIPNQISNKPSPNLKQIRGNHVILREEEMDIQKTIKTWSPPERRQGRSAS